MYIDQQLKKKKLKTLNFEWSLKVNETNFKFYLDFCVIDLYLNYLNIFLFI